MAIRMWTLPEFAIAWGRSHTFVRYCCRGTRPPLQHGATSKPFSLPDGFTAERNAEGFWRITGDEDLIPKSTQVTIYFAQEFSGQDYSVKIGLTKQAEGKRFDTLRTANWRDLTIVARMVGTREIERDLHQQFSHLNLGGEWHKPGPDLIEFIHDIRRTFPEIQPTTEPRLPHDLH